MANGLKLVLPGTFTDTSLPALRDDTLFPAAGALALFEPAHPANPMTGVPANAAEFPNIALPQVQAMYPSGTESGLSATMFVGTAFGTAGGFRERTSKGGLHLAAPTTNTGDTNRQSHILFGADLLAYINANQGHSFYTSMWGRVTRIGHNTAGVHMGRIGTAFQVAQFYTRPTGSTAGAAVYPIDGRLIGSRAEGGVGAGATGGINKTDTGPFIYSVGVTNLQSTATIGDFARAGDAANGAASGVSRYPAVVFYRVYVEDLTVSGRTYAQVDALSRAEYEAQVLTAGGRYYGDTWTAPPA